MKIIRILTIIAAIIFSGCATNQRRGNYVIRQNGAEIHATEIVISDEDNKVKYKDLDGKSGEIQGSFEIYKN